MIEVSSEQMDRIEGELKRVPKEIPKVITRAVNRAATAGRTEATKEARQDYYVKAKSIRDTIRIDKATYADPHAMILSRGKLLALSKFRITPKSPAPNRTKPIKVRVKRGEGGEIPNAFVSSMNSGHVGVYKRVGEKRLPITELYGPSIPQMLDNEDVRERVEERATEAIDERLTHEVNRVMERNS